MKDMPPRAAAAWVAQEAAKCSTPAQRATRIAQEESFVAMVASMGAAMPSLPNSEAAHRALISTLRAAG